MQNQSSETHNQLDPMSHLPLGDLLALGSHLRVDDTPESLLHDVAESLCRVVASPLVYVRLRNLDTDAFETVACVGTAPEQAALLRQTVVAPSTYQALLIPLYQVSESFLLKPETNALVHPEELQLDGGTLLVPLRGRGTRLIGVVSIILPTPEHTINSSVVLVIEAITRQAAMAVENVRLAERSARLLAKEQLLAALGRDLSTTLDRQTILMRTVERIGTAFGSGSLALLGADGTLEVIAAVAHEPELVGRHFSLGEGMIGRVAVQGQAYLSNDTAGEPGFASPDPEARSSIVVPLLSGGHVIGTLNVGARHPNAFTYEEVDLLEAIAAQVSGPITSAQLYAEAQSLAEQVQRRADQLAVLNMIARIASGSLEQTQSLPQVTAQIQQGFGYPQVDLFLIDEETSELVLIASEGSLTALMAGYRQHLNLGLIGRAARQGKSLCFANASEEPDFLGLAEREATCAELIVPIIASGRVLGLINLESPESHAFSEEDMHLIETVADILAGTVENVHLYRRAQAAAVLEERNRLARELHDSVTQQLFSMTLTSQAARVQLERNPQRVALQLERLQETSAAALAEMRALIFQLRPPALRDQGLVAALQQHAQMLSRREGIAIGLTVVGDERLARNLEQPLYRIVQEALNNVIKHASATHVKVVLEFTTEHVTVRITDNGTGFDLSSLPTGHGRHLGVLSMRERAIELGGSMDLHSTLGVGTEVLVRVPRVRERKEP